jgi:steroid 5-alpha reductase family enzyme
METDKKTISPTAFKLGLAGLIPFVVLAGSSFALPSSYKDIILLVLLAYGASISSFLGAIHWGLTMRDENPNGMYLIWGVMPSLIAWISLMLNPDLGLLLITALLWASSLTPKFILYMV